MGAPWVELPRDTIRHACGVTHMVSLTNPTATFHPRPIVESGFYATAYFLRSIPSQGYGLAEVKKSERDRKSRSNKGKHSSQNAGYSSSVGSTDYKSALAGGLLH